MTTENECRSWFFSYYFHRRIGTTEEEAALREPFEVIEGVVNLVTSLSNSNQLKHDILSCFTEVSSRNLSLIFNCDQRTVERAKQKDLCCSPLMWHSFHVPTKKKAKKSNVQEEQWSLFKECVERFCPPHSGQQHGCYVIRTSKPYLYTSMEQKFREHNVVFFSYKTFLKLLSKFSLRKEIASKGWAVCGKCEYLSYLESENQSHKILERVMEHEQVKDLKRELTREEKQKLLSEYEYHILKQQEYQIKQLRKHKQKKQHLDHWWFVKKSNIKDNECIIRLDGVSWAISVEKAHSIPVYAVTAVLLQLNETTPKTNENQQQMTPPRSEVVSKNNGLKKRYIHFIFRGKPCSDAVSIVVNYLDTHFSEVRNSNQRTYFVDHGSEFKCASFIVYMARTRNESDELVFGCANHGGCECDARKGQITQLMNRYHFEDTASRNFKFAKQRENTEQFDVIEHFKLLMNRSNDMVIDMRDEEPPQSYTQKNSLQHQEVKIKRYHHFKFYTPETSQLCGLYQAQELPGRGEKAEVELRHEKGYIKGKPLIISALTL
jgi:hypothetical protein